jgi:PAS domain S-box-containing protein
VLHLLLAVAFVFAALSITTPLLVYDAVLTQTGFTRKSGTLYPMFVVYFLAAWLTAFAVIVSKWRRARGQARAQLQYLAIGLFTSFAGGITTNLLFPFLLGRTVYTWLGPYFTLPLVVFVGHAIIRYRLMDIKVVIRKGVTYVSAIACAALVFLVTAHLLSRLTGYEQNSIPLLDAFVVAIILAIVFQPIKDWIQRSFNRYVYRESYDYQRTIRDASRRLSTMLELNPLLDYLVTIILDTFRSEAVTVYLGDPSGRTFTPRVPDPQEHFSRLHSPIPETSPLLTLLRNEQRTLVREEVARDTQHPGMAAAARAFDELGGEIAFPLLDHHTIVGIILVGPKRSGDPYFAEDIDLLETLTSQAAVAMKNAQLYRQVILVNEYVDNILSTMESGVIAVNASGEVSLFNPAAERLTGLPSSRINGSSYQLLPAALTSPLHQTLESRASRSQFETSLQHPDGFSVPLVCSTAVLSHKDGSTPGALIVFGDVTRLKDLEREKSRAERLASLGALASGVAHEIKNPLVAIRTFAELLPDRFTERDFREDFAKVVVREITRIDDLVARLRGIATTEPPQVGAIDISEPIKDTLQLLRAQLEQTRTSVHSDFQDPAPFVAVEEAQLKQLFLNVLLNAIEAMGPGGEITVRISRRDRQGLHWVVVEVSDTGPGIPESTRTSIFDPFFTTKVRGSGLGLAICRGIADAHRGTIRAENRKDRCGTVIVVEFPANSDRPLLTEEAIHR